MGDGKPPRAAKPWSKWSADTERAFLLALKLTGQASKAAREIGRSKNTAYSRRKADPAFAAAWDEAVAAQQAEWIAASRARLGPGRDGDADGADGRLTPWRDKAGGWDARKRGLFLRNLARGKNVAKACRAAGMSASAAYYLRGQCPRFAAAWEKALREDAPPSVLDAALERAINGWIEPIVAGGKVVGERRRYSDSLLRALLIREGETEKAARKAGGAAEAKLPKSKRALEAHAREVAKAAGGYFSEAFASAEDTDAVLMKKLGAIEARRAREAGEAEEREWARWRACWGELGAAPRRLPPAERQADIAGVRLLPYAPGEAGE